MALSAKLWLQSAQEKSSWRRVTLLHVCTQPPSISKASKCLDFYKCNYLLSQAVEETGLSRGQIQSLFSGLWGMTANETLTGRTETSYVIVSFQSGSLMKLVARLSNSDCCKTISQSDLWTVGMSGSCQNSNRSCWENCILNEMQGHLRAHSVSLLSLCCVLDVFLLFCFPMKTLILFLIDPIVYWRGYLVDYVLYHMCALQILVVLQVDFQFISRMGWLIGYSKFQ